MRISDETLLAYVDGELDEAAKARVDAAARTDAALARRIQAQRRLRQRMAGVFADLVAEAPPERLLEAARTPRAAAPVVDLNEARARRAASTAVKPKSQAWLGWAAVAACAVLAVGVAFRFGPQFAATGPIVRGPPGAQLAQGALAGALEKQLASSGPQPGQTIRVGVSFRSTQGRYCRTFDVATSSAWAGLACREPDGWKIRVIVDKSPAAAPSATYRQASSETPTPILAAVDGLIDGAPLDAKAEAAARTQGWNR